MDDHHTVKVQAALQAPQILHPGGAWRIVPVRRPGIDFRGAEDVGVAVAGTGWYGEAGSGLTNTQLFITGRSAGTGGCIILWHRDFSKIAWNSVGSADSLSAPATVTNPQDAGYSGHE